MNTDYRLDAAFDAARKNSQDTQSLASTNQTTVSDQSDNQKSQSDRKNYPIMDLNDITRDYERYKKKLWEERMLDLREMLQS